MVSPEGGGASSLLKRVADRTGACRAVISGKRSSLLTSLLEDAKKQLGALGAAATNQEALDMLDPLMRAFLAQALTAVATAWERGVSHVFCLNLDL
jgi:hypothetical protein